MPIRGGLLDTSMISSSIADTKTRCGARGNKRKVTKRYTRSRTYALVLSSERGISGRNDESQKFRLGRSHAFFAACLQHLALLLVPSASLASARGGRTEAEAHSHVEDRQDKNAIRPHEGHPVAGRQVAPSWWRFSSPLVDIGSHSGRQKSRTCVVMWYV